MEGSVRSPGSGEVVEEQLPLAYGAALRALTGCFAAGTFAQSLDPGGHGCDRIS